MRIAIVKLSALGDIVHAMAVLQFIKKYNQEILIDWVVEENYKQLLEYHPEVNKVHTVNLKKAKNGPDDCLYNTCRHLTCSRGCCGKGFLRKKY